jgi:hypothetical protein
VTRLVREEIRSLTTAGSNSDLLDVLFENPYSRIANVMRRCGVSRPTATGWLNSLVEGGTLDRYRGGRDRIAINTRFFDILARDEPLDERSTPPTLFGRLEETTLRVDGVVDEFGAREESGNDL